MMRVQFLLICLFFSALSLKSSVYATPIRCSTCWNEIEQEGKKIHCKNGHSIDEDCIHRQIQNTEDILRLSKEGLRCNGWNEDRERCQDQLSFEEIQLILAPDHLNELQKRMTEASKPSDPKVAEFQIRRLSEGIVEAFVICCPAGCGGALDKIEGCNAAKCSDPDCRTRFCYLCKDVQDNSAAVLQHVQGHSGGYWERRDGHTGQEPQTGHYTERDRFGHPYTYENRYHWLLARKKLATLFESKVDPRVFEVVMELQKPMLEERKMWPFPVGKNTQQWLQAVVNNRELSLDNKIAILQNEAIYRRQIGGKRVVQPIGAVIGALGGETLVSLDIKDAQRPVAQLIGVHQDGRLRGFVNWFFGQGQQSNDALVVHTPAVVAFNPPRVYVELEDWGHDAATQRFVQLGLMYRIGGLVLSGAPERRMTYEEAMNYCQNEIGGGARLPTVHEWRAIGRAMTRGGRYDPSMFPGMDHRWFWSSSPHVFRNAYYFINGHNLNVGSDGGDADLWVRCVRR